MSGYTFVSTSAIADTTTLTEIKLPSIISWVLTNYRDRDLYIVNRIYEKKFQVFLDQERWSIHTLFELLLPNKPMLLELAYKEIRLAAATSRQKVNHPGLHLWNDPFESRMTLLPLTTYIDSHSITLPKSVSPLPCHIYPEQRPGVITLAEFLDNRQNEQRPCK